MTKHQELTEDLKDEVKGIISRHQENINQMKRTIDLFQWNKGYVANCEEVIASYEQQIEEIKLEFNIKDWEL